MFALIDCNNFYASCEKLFRPDLHSQPVVVLSNNDGCIIARSQEAKRLGVKMGEPAFLRWTELREMNVNIFSANFALYGNMSHRVQEAVRSVLPETEIYSIDECFAQIDSAQSSDAEEVGKRVRDRVYRWTGITVSVGIAPTKTLAKLANHYCKMNPDTGGVFVIHEEQRERLLHETSVGDIWGVGHAMHRKLINSGIATALEFTRAPDEWIRKHFTVTGVRTVMELRGIACDGIGEEEMRKNICIARSFGEQITEVSVLCEAISNFAAIASEKLRRHNLCTPLLQVILETSPFQNDQEYTTESRWYRFPEATHNSAEVIRASTRAIRSMFSMGIRYKKAGVILHELVPAAHVQSNLFSGNNKNRMEKLMATADKINSSCKNGQVKFAVQGPGLFSDQNENRNNQRAWQLRRHYLSPCYTTRWDQIPVVNSD